MSQVVIPSLESLLDDLRKAQARHAVSPDLIDDLVATGVWEGVEYMTMGGVDHGPPEYVYTGERPPWEG